MLPVLHLLPLHLLHIPVVLLSLSDKQYPVSWIEQATIEIVKKDDTADVNLAGAVFGVYSDEACTKLITQLPATDKNGKSSFTIIKTQDTVYLKYRSISTDICCIVFLYDFDRSLFNPGHL